jgi:hypothetical protein
VIFLKRKLVSGKENRMIREGKRLAILNSNINHGVTLQTNGVTHTKYIKEEVSGTTVAINAVQKCYLSVWEQQ